MMTCKKYDRDISRAVAKFWLSRDEAKAKQLESGMLDQGSRANVTAGKNMDEFLLLFEKIILQIDKRFSIFRGKQAVTLPGFFRPTKQWDLLVMRNQVLVAAIELKSQVGSFGNNFNNRVEEALGVAVDFATAYRNGALGDQPQPFLGWVMLLEDCEKSREIVRTSSHHFPVFPEFENTSYAKRYDLFCKKLMLEKHYSSAALIMADSADMKSCRHTNVSKMTGINAFISMLRGHCIAFSDYE